jgi:pilus assembly protein Flp/PilA
VNLRETNPALDWPLGEGGFQERADGSLQMRQLVANFLADESGATAIEYCLIATGISIVIVVAVNGIGNQLNTIFVSVNNSLK